MAEGGIGEMGDYLMLDPNPFLGGGEEEELGQDDLLEPPEEAPGNVKFTEIHGVQVPILEETFQPAQNEMIEALLESIFLDKKHRLLECPSDNLRIPSIISAVLGILNREADERLVPRLANDATTPNSEKIFIATRNFTSLQKWIEFLYKFSNSSVLADLTIVVLAHPSQLCDECQDDFTCNLPNAPVHNCSLVGPDGSFRTLPGLKALGIRDKYCNFKFSRQLLTKANLILCSQEFLISRALQERYNINLEKAVVIFDDGGNLEEAFYREASISIRKADLVEISENLRDLYEFPMDTGNSQDLENLRRTQHSFENLAAAIDQESHRQGPTTTVRLREILISRGFGFRSATQFSEALFRALTWMESVSLENKQRLRRLRVKFENLYNARKFLFGLEYIHNSSVNQATDDFAMQISNYVPPGSEPGNTLQSSFTNFGAILETRLGHVTSLIVSSATLPSPDVFLDQIRPSPVVHRFSRSVFIPVPENCETFFAHCRSGPNGTRFEFDHGNRTRLGVEEEAGEALLQLAKVIPKGIVVFFTAIRYLREMVTQWQTSKHGNPSIWSRLEDHKPIFCELDFPAADDAKRYLQIYRQKCSEPGGGGAILLALHREKVSQLMNLKAGEVSCVISLGIPFHSIQAFHILSKQAYIKAKYDFPTNPRQASEQSDLWYYTEAWHKQDENLLSAIRSDQKWFAGLVLDVRFEKAVNKGLENDVIPEWGREKWQKYNSFKNLLRKLKDFINDQAELS